MPPGATLPTSEEPQAGDSNSNTGAAPIKPMAVAPVVVGLAILALAQLQSNA